MHLAVTFLASGSCLPARGIVGGPRLLALVDSDSTVVAYSPDLATYNYLVPRHVKRVYLL